MAFRIPIPRERLCTPAEFEQMPEFNLRYELIEGRVVEKPMPVFDHSEIAHRIDRAYARFDPDEKLGLLRYEVRMRLKNGEFRIPDLSYWIASRRPTRNMPTPAAPDLTIEIQSPDQSLGDLTKKALECVDAGVQRVWVIQPNKKIAALFRPGQSQPLTIQPNGELDGNPVIPGFKITLADLFS